MQHDKSVRMTSSSISRSPRRLSRWTALFWNTTPRVLLHWALWACSGGLPLSGDTPHTQQRPPAASGRVSPPLVSSPQLLVLLGKAGTAVVSTVLPSGQAPTPAVNRSLYLCTLSLRDAPQEMPARWPPPTRAHSLPQAPLVSWRSLPLTTANPGGRVKGEAAGLPPQPDPRAALGAQPRCTVFSVLSTPILQESESSGSELKTRAADTQNGTVSLDSRFSSCRRSRNRTASVVTKLCET